MTGPSRVHRNRTATSGALATTHAGNDVRGAIADEFMTRDQLAKRWKLKPKTLSNWHHLGKGPKCFRLAGGRYRYRTADIYAWERDQLQSIE